MLALAVCPKSSMASCGTIISASKDISSTDVFFTRPNRLPTSATRPSSARTDCAASIREPSARALRN